MLTRLFSDNSICNLWRRLSFIDPNPSDCSIDLMEYGHYNGAENVLSHSNIVAVIWHNTAHDDSSVWEDAGVNKLNGRLLRRSLEFLPAFSLLPVLLSSFYLDASFTKQFFSSCQIYPTSFLSYSNYTFFEKKWPSPKLHKTSTLPCSKVVHVSSHSSVAGVLGTFRWFLLTTI